MTTKKVLDKGYVTLVDHWGSDEGIIEAARMSTNKGFQGWDTDQKLLNYLYTHKHMTPFEMCGATFEIKAPIFVFREWHRHRTQSYNEMSARYVPLPDENYLPDVDDVLYRAQEGAVAKNRQASGTGVIPDERQVGHWRYLATLAYYYAQQAYQEGLNIGVPKELARITTPVARYSKMRASANLRNWMQFLTLRMDLHAQQEIREYAQTVCGLLIDKFPRTMNLFLQET